MSDQVDTEALPVERRRIAVLGEMLELGGGMRWQIAQALTDQEITGILS